MTENDRAHPQPLLCRRGAEGPQPLGSRRKAERHKLKVQICETILRLNVTRYWMIFLSDKFDNKLIEDMEVWELKGFLDGIRRFNPSKATRELMKTESHIRFLGAVQRKLLQLDGATDNQNKKIYAMCKQLGYKPDEICQKIAKKRYNYLRRRDAMKVIGVLEKIRIQKLEANTLFQKSKEQKHGL